MNKYVIITDSSSDLTKEIREKYQIADCIPNRFYYKDKEYIGDPDWSTLPIKV